MQVDNIWKRATRRLATRINAQGRRVQRRNLATEGRGTRSSWDKLNKRLEPLAQVDTHSGEVHWHASIREQWKSLYIISDEEERNELDPTLDDPEDTGEGPEEYNIEENDSEEEESYSDPRRDENNEY